MSGDPATALKIKTLLVEKLHLDALTPEQIADDMPLFGEGLGLDSVDSLELVVALEKEFSIRIQSYEVGREAFATVATLSRYLEGRLASADSHVGS